MLNCAFLDPGSGIGRETTLAPPEIVNGVTFVDQYRTDHSVRRVGSLPLDDIELRFGQEEPQDRSDVVYYFLTGVGGSGRSMAVAQCVAAQKGHVAYAQATRHNQAENALMHGARELSTVVNATELGMRKIIVALSMGGAIAALGAKDCNDVEGVILWAPGGVVETADSVDGLICDLFGNFIQVQTDRVKQFVKDPLGSVRNWAVEAISRATHPLSGPRLAVQSIKHTLQRPEGYRGEWRDLLDPKMQRKVQGSIRELVAEELHGGPPLIIVGLEKDLLIGAGKLAAAAKALGAESVTYDGPFSGHVGGTIHPAQAEFIIGLDRGNLAA